MVSETEAATGPSEVPTSHAANGISETMRIGETGTELGDVHDDAGEDPVQGLVRVSPPLAVFSSRMPSGRPTTTVRR